MPKLYSNIDMAEAAQPDPLTYGSFNEFFTRALKPGARATALGPGDIACPVDGTISEAGRIEGDRLLQAKGRHYTLTELLASQAWAGHFEGGSFATIYHSALQLPPHVLAMPLRGRCGNLSTVPGRLFSVNAVTAAQVPRLFARNERVLTLFEIPAHGEAAARSWSAR